ncbi:UNKNOWN [Stylonychia lemnae]|uniref:Uncharacterized protein n=1 Tax=Stylonychia lemnae TaxID=5949 RepID=A0A077ZZ55_STYLE|nr:UNKNOWN [Stylonychia lemnae]|eukprot:CDW75231.1 UNKNOWN [Stylonychia lemnae]
MEERKLKTLQPKIKLRELKSIQKGEIMFHKTLGSKPNTKSIPSSQLSVNDRDMKKILQLERMFERNERMEKRKQELRARREQRRVLQLALGADSSERIHQFRLIKREIRNPEDIDSKHKSEDQKQSTDAGGASVGGDITKLQKSNNLVKRLIEEYMGEKFDENGQVIPKKRGRGRRRKSSILAEKERMRQKRMYERELQRKIEEGEINESDESLDLAKLQQLDQDRKIMQDLDSKLRQEEDEMREILKDKNWYTAYIQKIISEQHKNDKLVKQTVNELINSSQDINSNRIEQEQNQIQQSSERSNYYSYLKKQLRLIDEQSECLNDKQRSIRYCMIQTPDQIKFHLEKVKTQLGKTSEALDDMKMIINIKKELGDLSGKNFNDY